MRGPARDRRRCSTDRAPRRAAPRPRPLRIAAPCTSHNRKDDVLHRGQAAVDRQRLLRVLRRPLEPQGLASVIEFSPVGFAEPGVRERVAAVQAGRARESVDREVHVVGPPVEALGDTRVPAPAGRAYRPPRGAAGRRASRSSGASSSSSSAATALTTISSASTPDRSGTSTVLAASCVSVPASIRLSVSRIAEASRRTDPLMAIVAPKTRRASRALVMASRRTSLAGARLSWCPKCSSAARRLVTPPARPSARTPPSTLRLRSGEGQHGEALHRRGPGRADFAPGGRPGHVNATSAMAATARAATAGRRDPARGEADSPAQPRIGRRLIEQISQVAREVER